MTARDGRAGAPAATTGSAPKPVTALPQPDRPEVAGHLRLVDQLLTEVCADLAHLWAGHQDDQAVDILQAEDLPQVIETMISNGGKRFRPVLTYLGWLSASGRAREIGHVHVVRAGAALELLHLFALVHDDVMDESDSRRGRPTVHTRAAQQHTEAGGRGDPLRFGESVAVLLGDLAHAEADALAAELPPSMRKIWRSLVIELVAGQRRDITGGAAGRRDLWHARQVARLKSGAYTVERPLELGAAAAQAPEVVYACLAGYGREVGEAFALRDDLLGVIGDPARTGKPSGDDLISGKPTVIVALAQERLSGGARVVLDRIGRPDLSREDVRTLQEALAEFGVISAVERRIAGHVDKALSALNDRSLDPDGAEQLARMAHQIAWRDR